MQHLRQFSSSSIRFSPLNVQSQRLNPWNLSRNISQPIKASIPLFNLSIQRNYSAQRVMPAKIIFVDKYDPNLRPSLLSWKSLKDWMMDQARSVQSLRRIRKSTKQSNQNIIDDCKDMYTRMNQALANRELKSLDEVVNEGMLVNLRSEMPPAGLKYVWNCEYSRNPRIVQARVGETPDGGLAQITIKMDTRQSLAAYDKQGNLMGGSETLQPLTEYVVLNRWIELPNSSWKIAGKI